ncbi:hypothetical protein Vretifemale_5995, partial [Volvox reticuliferus]
MNESDVSYNKTLMDVLLVPAINSSSYPTGYASAAAFLENGGSILLVSYWNETAILSYTEQVLTAPTGTPYAAPTTIKFSQCTPSNESQATLALYENPNPHIPVTLRGSTNSSSGGAINVTFPERLYGTYGSRGIFTLGCAAANVSGFHAMYRSVTGGQPLVEFADRGNGTVYYISYSWDDEGGAPKAGWN